MLMEICMMRYFLGGNEMTLSDMGLCLCDVEGDPQPDGYRLKKPCGKLYRAGSPVKCSTESYQVCRALTDAKYKDTARRL